MSWKVRKRSWLSERTKSHKCKIPVNWFGIRYGIGSIWVCDECNRVYEYTEKVSPFGRQYNHWGFIGYEEDNS